MAISKREAAKKIASKVKSKTKSKRNLSVERYQSQGQGNPQSKAWTEPNDEGVAAKPVGWRWTNLGASKLGKNPDSRPSNADVESYGSKSFKVKGETHRYLYTEKRVDKSDKNRSAKFYAGGTMGAGTFADGGTVGAGTFKKGGATFGGRQYDPYSEDADGQKIAKPIGWRYTDKLAKRLGKNVHSRPTTDEVEKYAGRGVYYEARQDKSDAKPSKKFISLQDGGTTGAGSFANGGETFFDKQASMKGGIKYYSVDIDTEEGQQIRDLEFKSYLKAKNVYDKYQKAMEYEGQTIEDIQLIAQYKDGTYDSIGGMADGGTLGAGMFKDGGDIDFDFEDKSGKYTFVTKRYAQDNFDIDEVYGIDKNTHKSVLVENKKDINNFGTFMVQIDEYKKDGGDVRQKGSQSGNPTRSLDKAQQAKPVGFRFRGNKYRRPSEQHIKQQLKLSPSDRDIYFERRKDKSDYSFEARLENGGGIEGAGMFARGGSTQYVPNDMIESITLSNGRVIKNDRIYDGAYVSKSLKLAQGGFAQGVGSFNMDGGMYARGGGVERVANSQSRDYSENLIPFKGANLEGKTLDNGDYVVLSYGYYPIWWYCKAEGKWYGNSTKYSVTTSKQMTQSRPTYDAKMVTKNELTDLMMKHHARFEDGGMLDGILGDTGAATTNGVGGTSFSSLDLTSNMDLTNPAF